MSVEVNHLRLEREYPIVGIPLPIPLERGKPRLSSSSWLEILLRFDVEAGEVAFDAAQIGLEMDDGKRLPTSEILGPLPRSHFHSEDWLPPAHPWVCTGERGFRPPSVVRLRGRGCLTLRFPVQPLPPERSFVLFLGGFEKEGTIIMVPPIRFTKGSQWGSDFGGVK
jgi:hypothetical protein